MKRVVYALFLLQLAVGVGYSQWLNADEEHGDNGPEKYYEWFYRLRSSGTGTIPDGAYLKALNARDALARNASAKNRLQSVQTSTVNWTNIGPYNIATQLGGPHGGRINTIAFDPKDSKIAYFGGANGGVWKTVNSGDSWNPTSDFAPALAMGAIAIDPKNPNIIFAGTGEYARGIGAFFGAGILRSSDAGQTWHPIGLSNVGAFSKIVIHPTNTNIIFASGAGSGGGLYRSTDGGDTWRKLGGGFLPAGDVTDIDLSASETSYVIYAAMPSHGLFRSDDGGDTWESLAQSYTQMRRMHVAVNPKDANDVVDLSIRYDGGFEGLQRSTDGGQNWDDISGVFNFNDPFNVGGSYQGWYDAYLARDPNNPDRIVLGGISVWLSEDAGSSWTDVGAAYAGGIHPDQHAAAFNAISDKFYAGCDGGIAMSDDRGNNFNVVDDSTAITESYGLAIDQTVDDATYIGTQDNGTLTGSKLGAWEVLGGGDGEKVVVDAVDHNTIYFMRPTSFTVSIYQGGESDFSTGLITSENDSSGWIKPLVQDETNHILYTGSQNLYIRNLKSGSSWTRRSRKLASGSGSYITCIGPSGDGTSLMVGTSDGNIWTTTDNGLTFKQSTGLPGRSVLDLAVSPADKQTFFAALSGFGGAHIYHTSDFGVTWAPTATQPPDVSCNKIVIDKTHPNHLYVATDVGVFYSPDAGSNWVPYGTALPNVACFDMAYHYNNRVLRVATHGRSVWEAPMADIPSGITAPNVSSVWYIGEPTTISWYGTSGTVKVELSVDNAATWQTITDAATGSSYTISAVGYPRSSQALVRVTSGAEVLLSQNFRITQRLAGSTLRTFAELPFYMYDLAYDGDDNVLWVTDFNSSDNKIYKLDPTTGAQLGTISVSGGRDFTGIKYDAISKHLFVNQVRQDNNLSFIFEIDITGAIIHKWSSPCQYGTGILPIGDTLLLADRNINTIYLVHKTNPGLSYNTFDLSQVANRRAAFGPRCLALNTKTGDLYHTWTDFQGTQANATLYDSYLLKLSRGDGSELASYFVQEGGNNGTNVRGVEYDPRSNGTEVWVTVLNSGNSSKIMKISLIDGSDSVVRGVRPSSPLEQLAVFPNPVHDFTSVQYSLSEAATSRIVVNDMLGRQVAQWQFASESEGEHTHRLVLGSISAGSYTISIYAGETLVGIRSIVLY